MKQHPQKQLFKTKLIQLLDNYTTVDKLFPVLKYLYDFFNSTLLPAVPFKVELIKTASIQYSVFYEASPDMSEQAIQITNTRYDAYLWTEGNGWCLNDDFYSVDEIAENVVISVPFEDVPENVKELEWLLANKFWLLILEQLPCFGETAPADTEELISWDDNYSQSEWFLGEAVKR
ncbi:hypothetical protein H0A36_08560 [Endozoicomonas sp. SM1973]|uniref:Uncharacterized protein n=1 Tax=Spartinivicinus marinus TaxID=2994442 RepID=A0A853HXY7_9GAMM|nr:hypothetical protein [Spartinivicinus marinus]MCX4027216.1 hypothetical protein [Spartinivicinus marinus]NYZ66063.1 hypothetical protein [Spartinivicinus marinus]